MVVLSQQAAQCRPGQFHWQMAHTPLHKRLAAGHKPQLFIKAHSLQPSVHRHTVRALFGGTAHQRRYQSAAAPLPSGSG